MSAKQIFEPRIVKSLTEGLCHKLAGANAGGGPADGHKSEMVIQELMIQLLQIQLPCSSLVYENRFICSAPKLGKCIPDVIIENVGGGFWGFFELKTLLRDDQLNAKKVVKDLEKLCAYKGAYPDAAAVFVLIGSRAKLFNPSRAAAWSSLKINYEPSAFSGARPTAQAINANFVAIPCGSYNLDGFPIACFMWEIQMASAVTSIRSATFRFEAAMA